jgi:hypothetical protein
MKLFFRVPILSEETIDENWGLLNGLEYAYADRVLQSFLCRKNMSDDVLVSDNCILPQEISNMAVMKCRSWHENQRWRCWVWLKNSPAVFWDYFLSFFKSDAYIPPIKPRKRAILPSMHQPSSSLSPRNKILKAQVSGVSNFSQEFEASDAVDKLLGLESMPSFVNDATVDAIRRKDSHVTSTGSSEDDSVLDLIFDVTDDDFTIATHGPLEKLVVSEKFFSPSNSHSSINLSRSKKLHRKPRKKSDAENFADEPLSTVEDLYKPTFPFDWRHHSILTSLGNCEGENDCDDNGEKQFSAATSECDTTVVTDQLLTSTARRQALFAQFSAHCETTLDGNSALPLHVLVNFATHVLQTPAILCIPSGYSQEDLVCDKNEIFEAVKPLDEFVNTCADNVLSIEFETFVRWLDKSVEEILEKRQSEGFPENEAKISEVELGDNLSRISEYDEMSLPKIEFASSSQDVQHINDDNTYESDSDAEVDKVKICLDMNANNLNCYDHSQKIERGIDINVVGSLVLKFPPEESVSLLTSHQSTVSQPPDDLKALEPDANARWEDTWDVEPKKMLSVKFSSDVSVVSTLAPVDEGYEDSPPLNLNSTDCSAQVMSAPRQRRQKVEPKQLSPVRFGGNLSVVNTHSSNSSSKNKMSFLDALKTLGEADEGLSSIEACEISSEVLVDNMKVCHQADSSITDGPESNLQGNISSELSSSVIKWGPHDVSSSDSSSCCRDEGGEYATYYTQQGYHSDVFDSSSGYDSSLLKDVHISGEETLDLRVDVSGRIQQDVVSDIADVESICNNVGVDKITIDTWSSTDSVDASRQDFDAQSNYNLDDSDESLNFHVTGDELSYQFHHCSSSSDYYVDSSDVEMNRDMTDGTSDSDLLLDLTLNGAGDDESIINL